MKIILYIASAICIFFGVLFIWSAFTPGNSGSLIIGVITVAIGFGLIYFASRRTAKAGDENVTLKIDMPGNVNMDTLKCKSCGGTLAPENITMVAGAPVVTCPYCHTTYQLTEEPKW
jgi:uncharacterized membrane protein